jgi:hypothetical protein
VSLRARVRRLERIVGPPPPPSWVPLSEAEEALISQRTEQMGPEEILAVLHALLHTDPDVRELFGLPPPGPDHVPAPALTEEQIWEKLGPGPLG